MTAQLLTVSLFLLPTVAPPVARTAPEPAPSDRPEAYGLWPSPPLIDLMLRRWASEVSAQYGLDAAQREKVVSSVSKRWGTFFREHQAELVPLFSDYLTMQLGVEPPDERRVRAFARRAAPMLSAVRKEMEGGLSEFRDTLTPQQLGMFEQQARVLRERVAETASWLERLERGAFEPKDLRELWEPPGRRSAQADGSPGKQVRPGGVVKRDRVTEELDAWREYVVRFADDNKLDEGQRDAAFSVLAEMTARAAAWRDARRDAMAGLERLIASFSGSKVDQDRLTEQLAELYGPFDKMFAEMKNRLENILTQEQRARLKQAEPHDGDARPHEAAKPDR